MKAEELRIGNWVKGDTGKPFQIELSDFLDWWNDHNSHEYGDHIHPIPLTEDWLVKFGFNEKYKSIHNHWYIGGFALEQKSDEDDDGNSIPTEQVFYYDWKLDVKWVHQLQNLYFALTGEELNLK